MNDDLVAPRWPSPQLGAARADASVQTVLVLPVVVSVFLVGAQFASLAHAGQVATVISQRGASTAARQPVGPGAVVAALDEMERASWELRGRSPARVHVAISRDVATATTSLEIESLLPFLSRRVSRSVTAPRETFLLQQDR